jgi:undecaprenyl-diphosphatase
MNVIQSIIIAIVEGITEFLPISSTAHMAFTANLLGITDKEYVEFFIENIQFGAILSVVVLYWKKFFDIKRINFYYKLFIAVIPAIFIGLAMQRVIGQALRNPFFLAVIMVAGGIILLFVDSWFKKPSLHSEKEINYKQSFIIGMYQVLAVIFPGLSRSAATIIGGMQQKLTRSVAAEFSFFLAVPTLFGAFVLSIYSTHKYHPDYLQGTNLQMLITGNVVAFVVAMFAIKFFISFLKRYGFQIWGIYRIILGIVLLILIYTGFISS